jgi:hypothetical protein
MEHQHTYLSTPPKPNLDHELLGTFKHLKSLQSMRLGYVGPRTRSTRQSDKGLPMQFKLLTGKWSIEPYNQIRSREVATSRN